MEMQGDGESSEYRGLLHTQAVTGSSPVAPTISFHRLTNAWDSDPGTGSTQTRGTPTLELVLHNSGGRVAAQIRSGERPCVARPGRVRTHQPHYIRIIPRRRAIITA